ncbi:MAG: hypothetical protein QME58_14300 [Bacteroidota bacterium]|nr:hypothetical protein [Bacteroidota bacterium]
MRTKVFFYVWVILFVISIQATQVIAETDSCTTVCNSTTQQYINSTITLKILLVEFTDIRHQTSPSAYSKDDFENMLVTSGSYVYPIMLTPDGDQVYGSMRDYFQKMSSGNLTINGLVVNTTNGNTPNWVLLPHNKQEYQNYTYDIFSDAINIATLQGLDVSNSATVKLSIIYAGNIYFNFGGLNPRASGNSYIMSEREGRPYTQENLGDKFARIGVHCHEFAHLIGIGHSSGSRADLMEAGRRNGNGAAPAPLNPGHRALKGWLTPTVITGQQQFDAYYSLTAPQVFRINSNYGNDYFLIENRRFNQTMVIGSTTVPDYNNSAFFPPARR